MHIRDVIGISVHSMQLIPSLHEAETSISLARISTKLLSTKLLSRFALLFVAVNNFTRVDIRSF